MKTKADYWLSEDGLIKLTAWSRDGLTIDQIAHNAGLASSTLRLYKDKYPAISEALARGKEVSDIIVENALYKRAIGYEYEEVITEADSTGKKHKRIYSKHVSPDVKAITFWLSNRIPDRWRDRHEANISAKVEQCNPFEGLTTDELREIVKE